MPDPDGRPAKPRSESNLDAKIAHINAILRFVVVTILLLILALVIWLSASSYHTTQDNQAILQAALASQAQLQDAADANKKLNNKIVRLAEDIEDCNTPDGKCYARRIAELASQTGAANAVTLAAAACITQEPWPLTQRDVRDCVNGAFAGGH